MRKIKQRRRNFSGLQRRAMLMLSSAIVSGSALTAQAQTTWNNASTDAAWSTNGNWSTNTEPASADNVVLPTPIPAGGGTITLSAGETANQLTINDAYTLTGGDLTLTTGGINVASTFTGTINSVLSGSNGLAKSGAGTLALGGSNTFTGNTTITGGYILASNNNAFGTGSVTLNSGGRRVLLSDGITLANSITINSGVSPDSGRGILEGPDTGSATFGGNITINAAAGNGGHINGGTGLTFTGTITSSVAITQRAGTVTYNNTINAPRFSVNAGTATWGAANLLPNTAIVDVANTGTATWITTGNFNQTISALNLGLAGNTALGTVNFGSTGTGVLTLNGDVTTVGNGSHVIRGRLNLGGATRTFNVADGTNANDLNLTELLITNGSLDKTGAGNLRFSGASSRNMTLNEVTISAGTFTHNGGGASYVIGGAAGTGLTTVKSGATIVWITGAALNSRLVLEAGSNAQLRSAGATGTVPVSSIEGSGNILAGTTSGTGAFTLSVGANNLSTTYSGVITESIATITSGLTKTGTGTLTLTGDNIYRGPTAITAGKLVINGNQTASTGAVSVSAGATLGGTGTIGGSTTLAAGAILTPGNSIGTLTLANSLTLTDGALFTYELGATGDSVSMPAQTLTLNNQEFGDFTFLPEAGFGTGTYTLFDAGTISGTLGTALTGVISFGGTDYNAALAIDGANNNVVLNVTTTAIPEPSTLVLAGLGMLGFAGLRLRRHRQTG